MRRVKRELPTKPNGDVNPIYFQVEADGLDARWFRLPNDRQVVELLQLLARADGHPPWVAERSQNHGFSTIFMDFRKLMIFVEK